jgi:hypothetical protein
MLISAPDTDPFALWSATRHLDELSEELRQTRIQNSWTVETMPGALPCR